MRRLIKILSLLAFSCSATEISGNNADISTMRHPSISAEINTANQYVAEEKNKTQIAGLQFEVKKKLSDKMKVALNEQSDSVRAYYFVSFSIPESGMKAMIQDAKQYQLPMVLNGMKDNNILKTANEFLKYYKDNNEGGMMIDPTVFDEFKVKAVPAVVVACGDKYDIVYGSVKIKNALELISRSGDCAEGSKIILSRDRR